jgi:beta-glucosidase
VFDVKAGKQYRLELFYAQNKGAAVLNFDLGHTLYYPDDVLLAAAKQADAVVFVGGISPRPEGEEMKVDYSGFKGGDRTSIELPAVQRDMIALLRKASDKLVYVNCSGSAVGLVPETHNADAIVQAWYAGEKGGDALADILFGDANPSGKLPVTFYKNVEQLPDFLDYRMKGRTYRYMTDKPLFPFGFGLSYSQIEFGKPKYKKGNVTVDVKNVSDRDADEVVQVYIRRLDDVDGPVKTLRAFKRVSVPAGRSVKVSLPLSGTQFETWDEATNSMRVVAGEYDVMVGNSSDDSSLQHLSVKLK